MSGGLSMRPVAIPPKEGEAKTRQETIMSLLNKVNPFAASTAEASEGAALMPMPRPREARVDMPVPPSKNQKPTSGPAFDEARLDRITRGNTGDQDDTVIMVGSRGETPVIKAMNDAGEMEDVSVANLGKFRNNEAKIIQMLRLKNAITKASMENPNFADKYRDFNIPYSSEIVKVVGGL